MLNPNEKDVLKYVIDEYARNNPVVGVSGFLARLSASDEYARQLIAEYATRALVSLEQKLVTLDEDKSLIETQINKLKEMV